MPGERAAKVRRNMRTNRAKLRAQGLRPVTLWVPDTRSEEFKAEIRRQSLLLRDDPQEKEILDWIAEVADTDGWK